MKQHLTLYQMDNWHSMLWIYQRL